MKLYDLDISGNCYRVRLLLSLLGVEYELVTVNLMKGEHREPWGGIQWDSGRESTPNPSINSCESALRHYI